MLEETRNVSIDSEAKELEVLVKLAIFIDAKNVVLKSQNQNEEK